MPHTPTSSSHLTVLRFLRLVQLCVKELGVGVPTLSASWHETPVSSSISPLGAAWRLGAWSFGSVPNCRLINCHNEVTQGCSQLNVWNAHKFPQNSLNIYVFYGFYGYGELAIKMASSKYITLATKIFMGNQYFMLFLRQQFWIRHLKKE